MNKETGTTAIADLWTVLRPRTFSQVVGRSSAVNALAARVRGKAHGMHFILHGPSGVGKRMLAKLYAKAVFCLAPDPSGSSCNLCERCIDFDKGETLAGLVETTEVRRGDWVERLLMAVRDHPWSDRRIVILDKADEYQPADFDKLLKTVEEDLGTSTTFIFLADDLNRMRRAGRSRCFTYRVRHLTIEEAESIVQTLVLRSGVTYDEHALTLLVQASEGLPSRVISNWSKVTGEGEISVQRVRKALELEWGSDAARYWQVLLADEGLPAAALYPSDDIGLNEQVRRVRTSLQRLKQCLGRAPIASDVVLDPSFLFLDDDPSPAIANLLQRRAELIGKKPMALWNELARVWLSHDITDAPNFFEAGRLSYRLSRSS